MSVRYFYELSEAAKAAILVYENALYAKAEADLMALRAQHDMEEARQALMPFLKE